MSYQIKHMGLGGILDQAIAITKNEFALLFSIMLLLLVPYNLLIGFTEWALKPELPAESTIEDQVRVQRAMAEYWPFFTLAELFSIFFIIPLTNAAVIQAVARVYLGQPITAAEAFRHGVKRLAALLGTTILMYLAIWAGLLLFIIPGIYLAIWYGLAQHVVVIEGLSGTTALGRSKKLVHRDRGQFLALGFIAIIITVAVNMAANYIPQPHVRLVGSTLLQAVTTILWTAAGVVFYFSCRCGVENFDLQYLAESIGADQPETEESIFARSDLS